MSKGRKHNAAAAADAKRKRMTWLFFAGGCLCLLVAGCIPAPGMDCAPYVVLAYVATVVAAGLSAARMLGLPLWRIKPADLEPDPEKQAESASIRLMAAIIASIAAAVGDLLYLVINGFDVSFGLAGDAGGVGYSVGFIILMLAAAGCFARTRQHVTG